METNCYIRKRIIFLIVIVFMTINANANQIDEVPRLLEEITHAIESGDSVYAKLDNIFRKLEKLDTLHAGATLRRLCQKSLENDNDKQAYCAHLMTGVYYFDHEDYRTSISYLERASAFCHKKRQTTYVWYLKGVNYLNLKMLKIANECLSMVIRQSEGDSCLNIVRCEAYNALSKYFEATEQKEEAFQYLKSYTQLYDSISKKTIEDFYQVLPIKMHAKYYNRQAYVDNKEEISELKDRNNLKLVGIIAMLALAIGTTALGVHSKITNSKLKKLNSEIDNKAEELSAKTSQLEKANADLAKLSVVAGETINAAYIVNNLGKVVWVNKGFEHLYALNLQQYIAMNGENIFKSRCEARRKAFEDCKQTQKPQTFETNYSTPNTIGNWIQSTITPVTDKDGNIIQYVVIDTDISRIKSAESEIKNQNSILTQQKEDLENKNRQIENQRDELEFKNQKIYLQNEKITGGIRYAQTIQNLILPDKKNISQYFDNFIIYRPKDIVSGDFYWFNAQNGEYFAAVGDCTGHGVPGAFMSVLCSRMLDETIVNENQSDPAIILTSLETKIVNALKQRENSNADGLDISICRIKPLKNNTEVTVAGAKSFFFYPDGNQIKIFKGTRKSIGGIFTEMKKRKFENFVVMLKNNDCIYLSSDGIIDQNNDNRRSLGSLRLAEIINNYNHLPMSLQQQKIEENINNWQQNSPQRDDFCLLGIKISQHQN